MTGDDSQTPPSGTPIANEESPVETYEKEQVRRREAAMDRERALWLSFILRQCVMIMILCTGLSSLAGGNPYFGAILLAVIGGVWVLSWMVALQLGLFVIQNQELLQWRIIVTAFLPIVIVAAEALGVLSMMPPLNRPW